MIRYCTHRTLLSNSSVPVLDGSGNLYAMDFATVTGTYSRSLSPISNHSSDAQTIIGKISPAFHLGHAIFVCRAPGPYCCFVSKNESDRILPGS